MPALRYREIEEADAAVFADMRRFIERWAVGVPDVEFAMWMVATVAHAAIHNGVAERPHDVDSGRLVDELVVLLVRYLKRPRLRQAPTKHKTIR
jgi:hypothetical protein